MAPDMPNANPTGSPSPELLEGTGLALRDPLAWRDLVEVVESAEQTGYRGVFLPEIAGREALSTLAALAGVTSELRLGTGVVTIVTRQPHVTAMAAATVHERSAGRAVLGLGTGPSGPGALERLRAYVTQVRTVLSGGDAEDGFRLSLDPGPAPVPIWIAALGPRAMTLAGEVADGVLLNWCTPERVADARARVRQSAEAAGRDPDAVTIAVYVRACVGQEPAHAMPALREMAGQYASYPAYRRQFEAMGLGEEAAKAAAAHEARRSQDVPETLVGAVCLAGEAMETRARLQAFRDAGADLPVVYPVACLDPLSSILGTLFALAPSLAVEH